MITMGYPWACVYTSVYTHPATVVYSWASHFLRSSFAPALLGIESQAILLRWPAVAVHNGCGLGFCEAEALHKGKHQEMLDGLPDKIGLYIS